MVAVTSGEILGNVAVYQPSLAKANFGIGFAQSAFPFAQGFDFGADQDHAGFEAVQQMVVVGSLAVLRNNLDAFVLGFIRLGFHGRTIIAAGGEPLQAADDDGFPRYCAGINEIFIENLRGASIIHTSNTTLGIPCCILGRVLDSIGTS